MGLPPTVAPAGLNLAGSQTQDLCGSGFVTELTAAEGGQRLGGAWKGVPKQLKAVPVGRRQCVLQITAGEFTGWE